MFYRLGIPLLLAASVWSVDGTPRVLSTFSEVVDYATNGAPIMISVNYSFCAADFPKNLLAYSFTNRLDFAIINQDSIEFNRESVANGSRIGIIGPAIRLITMRLDSSGQAKFQVTDSDWKSGSVVIQGSMTCHMGTGLKVTATEEKGNEFEDYASVVGALEGGYRVFTYIDLQTCPEKSPKNTQKLQADGIQVFGEVIDHRFSPGGHGSDFAFSKQRPFLNGAFRFERGYGDVKTNSDGSADIYYWEFDPVKAIAPRHHFSCTLGKNLKYFRQP